MSVQVKLRNGRIMDATEVATDTYEVTLASGSTKIYALADLISVMHSEQQADVNNNIVPKEDKKMINHYLQQVNFAADAPLMVRRIISSRLDTAVAEDYTTSMDTKRPVGNIYAIQSGTWNFNLLEAILINRGIDFKMMVLSNKDVALLPEGKLNDFLKFSTFSYAGPSYTFFLTVYNSTVDFGLEDLGITIEMAKKSAKRLQEMLRMTEMSVFLNADAEDHISIDMPELGGDAKFYDGKSYIRRSLAIRCCANVADPKRRAKLIRAIKSGKLVHVHFRMLTFCGLFKGDAVICKDSQLHADLVTVPDNLKTEMKTDGYSIISMWEHELVHMAVWDDQSSINFGAALTESDQKGDIARLVRNVRESITSGTLPEWLLMGEDAHNDDGTPNIESLADSINKAWIKVQAHGMDVRAIQNATYMGLGGVIKRLDGAKRGGYYRKMWVPMTNALLLTINTWESATRMGRFTFPNRDRNVCFFDPRVGFVMPGKRFVETYNLHGGWDLDDSMKVKRIKVWCSDSNIIGYHRGKTIAADAFIPLNQSEAVDMALLVRSPNGPGEYSIEIMDFDGFPLPEELNAPITLVDLAKMPLPQDFLLDDVEMAGMPTSTEYSHVSMTRDDAQEMIEAQLFNPGVGQFCNAMMVWADSMGPSFPPMMLDKMEEIVDACQQGFDAASFEAIKEESDNIFAQLINMAPQVDAALAATRMPYKYAKKMRLVAGRFARTQKFYAEAIETIRTELLNHTLEMRSNTDLVAAVSQILCGEDSFHFAEAFYGKYRLAFSNADSTKKADLATYGQELEGRKPNPFAIMSIHQSHKLAMENIVECMVEEFTNLEEDVAHRYIIGLYKFLACAPVSKKRYDRIIFQPGKETSLLDLLIHALIKEGLAQPLPIKIEMDERAEDLID